jgi:hypothetical protein
MTLLSISVKPTARSSKYKMRNSNCFNDLSPASLNLFPREAPPGNGWETFWLPASNIQYNRARPTEFEPDGPALWLPFESLRPSASPIPELAALIRGYRRSHGVKPGACSIVRHTPSLSRLFDFFDLAHERPEHACNEQADYEYEQQ